MLIWYADDSEFTGDRGAEIPDVMLFGGLVANARDVGVRPSGGPGECANRRAEYSLPE